MSRTLARKNSPAFTDTAVANAGSFAREVPCTTSPATPHQLSAVPARASQRQARPATERPSVDGPGRRPKPNHTGMPDRLKAGIEALAGIDLSDIRVHTNSSKPSQLRALACAQGNEIHLAPGQEHHLAHESWHIVQQRQGRVRPTLYAGGVAVNDDPGLEREADIMGERARRHGLSAAAVSVAGSSASPVAAPSSSSQEGGAC